MKREMTYVDEKGILRTYSLINRSGNLIYPSSSWENAVLNAEWIHENYKHSQFYKELLKTTI